MSKLNPLSTHRRVIEELFQQTKSNHQKIFDLNKFSFEQHSDSFIRKFQTVSVDTTPVYYDLYKFMGITYTTGPTPPDPASAYEERETEQWFFIHPTIGFAVSAGETPESVTNNATPWEFQTTVAVVKSEIQYQQMPDWAIDGTKIISYLYKEDGTDIGDIKFVLQSQGRNLNEISVDFNNFYRWVKLSEGYILEYYAIYPLPSSELFINATLYFNNPNNSYYAKPQKI